MTSCHTILAKDNLIKFNSDNYDVSEASQTDTQKLAKGLLDKALEDIKASEVLYHENLKGLAIFHLEQASEKILKAYFIGYLRKSYKYFFEMYEFAERTGAFPVKIPDKYERVHQKIKGIIKQLTNPKNLGHDFAGFLDKQLKDLSKSICEVGFEGYLEFLANGFIAALYKQKQKFIKRLLDKGLNSEQAENKINSSIYILSQLFQQLITSIKTYNFTSSMCSNEVSSSTDIEEASKEIGESQEPCIHENVEIYKSITKDYRDYLEKLLKENLKAMQTTNNIITSSIDSSNENLKTFIEIFYYDTVVPIFLLLLHLCLYKYYNISRYPEGEIPEEEYEAIPEALELLKEVHKTVECIIQFFPELELRLD